MSFLDEVHAKREKLAAVLGDEDYSGIREIVEELYPDRAHFLFELLQNAEDTGATEVTFDLQPTCLTFEHNGRPFDEADVWGITNIGKGTKKGQPDKIGRFGVGFKAVFAYSETPHIWSPTFCFKITELVLPSALPPKQDLGTKTRFEFPFNNPKKAADVAFTEVAKGLSDLAKTTLLFLSHLQSISWQVNGGAAGKVLRVQHSANHVEVLKQGEDKTSDRSHFLKFDRPVVGIAKQLVAVAFPLDFLPDVQGFDPARPLAQQLRVVPASPGRVAVFFPAEKETSGLRFHLHAPFVPELSRASIKETPANLPLFEQLATLSAESLHQIRDLGLLTTAFLEVLPNGRDQVDDRYKAIRSAIIEEMNDQPLTPTQSKSHAPARHLLQGKASLKSLLSDEDIEFLVDYDDEPWRWAAGSTQKSSNADRFLEGLAIGTWDVDAFVELLCTKTDPSDPSGPPEAISSDDVMKWLQSKPIAWHQELYSFLFTDYLMAAGWKRDEFASQLASLRIVRLTDGGYGVAGESFFLSDEVEHDEVLRRVDEGVYSTGKSKGQKENAKAFLEEIGVRAVGQAELVEAILKRRYTYEAESPDERAHKKDLKRFVELVEAEPAKASLFAGYYIFKGVDLWRPPSGVFLDQPFLETGLSAFYHALGDETDRAALHESYRNCGIGTKRLAKFALAVGATGTLEIQETTCRSNPDVSRLAWAAPGKWSVYGINRDFHIPGLDEVLQTPNAALSQLIWKTLCEQEDDSWTTARYRNNSNWPIRTAPSQLACVLKNRAWVPQTDGRFVCPAEATRALLPAGFPSDPGWSWLHGIDFGLRLAKQSEELHKKQALAKELGFQDNDALDRAKRFAAFPPEEQQRILMAWEETRGAFELPEREPTNPTRRAERVTKQATEAPERITEERVRSVSVGRDAVKQEAGQYLRQQYTNADGEMICQVCKKRQPFTLDDGSDYFERVEFLPDLKRRHKQNYLALCPNHGAMFQYANGSTQELRGLVVDLAGNELAVVLAREDKTIYFTKTHLADLRAIISADESEAEPTDEEAIEETDPRVVPSVEI